MYKLIQVLIFSSLLILGTSAYSGQDPMRPPSWTKQKPTSSVKNESIKLQQILISEDRKVVIINDQILMEGQSVSGMKITKIEATQVMFRRAGVSKIIKLLPVAKGVKHEI